MKRATIVVAMILLLGSASVAAAECAWVLWERMRTIGQKGELGEARGGIGIVEAYLTQDKCNSARVATWEKVVQMFNQPANEIISSNRGRTFNFKGPDGTIFMQEFYCLPDTIDPREKQ